LLLEHKKINPTVNDNFAIKYSVEHGQSEIVELLLNHEMIDSSIDNNYLVRYARQKVYSGKDENLKYSEIVQLLEHYN